MSISLYFFYPLAKVADRCVYSVDLMLNGMKCFICLFGRRMATFGEDSYNSQ